MKIIFKNNTLLSILDMDGSIERFIVESGKQTLSLLKLLNIDISTFLSLCKRNNKSYYFLDGSKKGRAWNIKKLVKFEKQLFLIF